MKRMIFCAMLLIAGMVYPIQGFSQSSGNSDLEGFLTERNYVPIKLEKLKTGHLSLTASVNGISALFVLDTGAGATVLDQKLSDKFNLSMDSSSNTATGAGGSKITLQESVISELKLQDYVFNNFKAHLMSLDHINNAFKGLGLEETDGVIGADILTTGKAIIDYENLVLYLHK